MFDNELFSQPEIEYFEYRNGDILYYRNIHVRKGLGREIDMPTNVNYYDLYKENGGFLASFRYHFEGSNSGDIAPVTRINYKLRFENNYQNPNSTYTAY
ncbi:hypothetical protein V1503_24635 [Bacillus sp. SCS-151]|uniref:hypothetical protein n=1 Tax=Nanhaiella sioensis TaxID=3115293 RepID=UPI00397DB6B6